MHCKTRQLLHDLFSVNQGDGSEMAQICHWSYWNQPQKFENLAMIEWPNAGSNLNESVI